MQGVTAIAPAVAALFTLPFIVSNAGVTAPLAYLGAFVIALMLGYVLAQYSSYMTSTGTYYTFVSNSLGARRASWWPGSTCSSTRSWWRRWARSWATRSQTTLKEEYGWTFKWWWFMVFLIALVAFTATWGIELSTGPRGCPRRDRDADRCRTGIAGFADPGPGGVNLQWLNPQNAPSGHALFLGVVFAIFAMAGWDAAAPLGEESEDPKKTIPRGVIGCIVILGFLLVFTSWGQITGWGTDRRSPGCRTPPSCPHSSLGQKYWGGAWVIVLIALLNSAIAVAIAGTNTATRFLYGMAKTGVVPHR